MAKKHNPLEKELQRLKGQFETQSKTIAEYQARNKELTSQVQEVSKLRVDLEYSNEQLRIENKNLKAAQVGNEYRVEVLYRRCLELDARRAEWQSSANFWKKAHDRKLEMINNRGAVRAKYDPAFAIWRDAMMGTVASGADFISLPNLAAELGRTVGGQLPDGSNDFMAALKRLAEEFGYDVDKSGRATPAKPKPELPTLAEHKAEAETGLR
jgi:hypothetical protein